MNEQREESKFFRLHKQDQKKTNWKFLPEKPWLRFEKFFVRIRIQTKTKNYFNTPTTGCRWLYLGLKWLLFYSSFCFDPEKNFQIFHLKQN